MRLIDANELKDKIPEVSADIFENCGRCKLFDDVEIKHLIDAQPTIEAVPLEDYRSMEQTVYKLTQALSEAERKHGRWIPSDKGDCTYICSECGFVRDAYILAEKAYCPHCGARMDEQQEVE